jgi:hypothetical protein
VHLELLLLLEPLGVPESLLDLVLQQDLVLQLVQFLGRQEYLLLLEHLVFLGNLQGPEHRQVLVLL